MVVPSIKLHVQFSNVRRHALATQAFEKTCDLSAIKYPVTAGKQHGLIDTTCMATLQNSEYFLIFSVL